MNSRIYQGEVMHARLEPVQHRFRYPVYFYAFDLEELPALDRSSALFGHNRIRPVAIHDRDYLWPEADTLRSKVERVLEDAAPGLVPGRIVMVTAARYFHYVFNPISFFYCCDQQGALAHIVVQVNNTFGEMHLYPLAVAEAAQADGKYLLHADKAFHVSPFFSLQGRYEFLLTDPGETIDNTIRYYNGEQLSLVARIHGRGDPLTPAALGRTIVKHPVSASLTMPRILWQAARLYVQRKLPVYNKPVPEHRLTVRPVPPAWVDRLGMRLVMRFLQQLPRGELCLGLPDGSQHRFGAQDGLPAVSLAVREYRFFRRVMLSGDIGFGEAYTDGDWTSDDLPGLLTLLASCQDEMDDRGLMTAAVGRLVNYLRHLRKPNTVRGSTQNIRAHYDLSNRFFATFLDPSLTYSCGLFRTPEDTLEQAQRNKLHSVIDKAELTAEDHVLEIGCGWGSFAIEAVRQTGCRVTGITVSKEQLDLAQQRVAEAGLTDRIDLRFCDYRHVAGEFSKIVSIEMLEAVGHAGLKPFFAACDRALQPGGRAVIQVITIADRKYQAYRYSSDWIRKHIFPGGHLPSLGVLKEIVADASRLQWHDPDTFAADYARTLACWRQALLAHRPEIHDLGFDERFLRTWEYYFAYCQAGFSAGLIDLAQIVLQQPER
ncbi:MAG: DUF1365 family protein [Desulfuromonadales bacterium]